MKHLAYADDPADALRHLMTAYGQDVWNYAYVFTRRADAADDIAQDVFLNAYKSFNTFEGRSVVKTWLLAMTRNASLNYLKSSYVKKVLAFPVIRGEKHHPSAEQEAMQAFETNRIWSLVLRLKPVYREALVLNAHYELSLKDIAALLGVSEGTVKSRLHRARAKLEKLLQEEEEA